MTPVPDDKNQDAIQQQMENEAVYRELLVQGVLAVLLPTEDLENASLTTLVGQIFSEMILGNGIGGKASEPWLLWEGITKIAEVIQDKLSNKSKAQALDRSYSNSSEPVPLDITGRTTKSWNFGRSIQKAFWLVLQYVFLAVTAARFLITSIATSSSLPSRIPPAMKITGSGTSQEDMGSRELKNPSIAPRGRPLSFKQPILKMKVWSCAASLLDLGVRMPWISATISILQWGALMGPGEVGNTDGPIDK